jgi:hypothetical protein
MFWIDLDAPNAMDILKEAGRGHAHQSKTPDSDMWSPYESKMVS